MAAEGGEVGRPVLAHVFAQDNARAVYIQSASSASPLYPWRLLSGAAKDQHPQRIRSASATTRFLLGVLSKRVADALWHARGSLSASARVSSAWMRALGSALSVWLSIWARCDAIVVWGQDADAMDATRRVGSTFSNQPSHDLGGTCHTSTLAQYSCHHSRSRALE